MGTIHDTPARYIASKKDASYNQGQDSDSFLTLIDRHAFLKLPMDLRRNLLEKQASQMADYYQHDSDWRELEGSDLVEYICVGEKSGL